MPMDSNIEDMEKVRALLGLRDCKAAEATASWQLWQSCGEYLGILK
jgi:hypothetical protein